MSINDPYLAREQFRARQAELEASRLARRTAVAHRLQRRADRLSRRAQRASQQADRAVSQARLAVARAL